MCFRFSVMSRWAAKFHRNSKINFGMKGRGVVKGMSVVLGWVGTIGSDSAKGKAREPAGQLLHSC